MLNDPEWTEWSDRKIAEKCALGHSFVSKLRPEASVHGGQIEPEAVDGFRIASRPRKAIRNGTTYTMKTEKIGAVSKAAFSEIPAALRQKLRDTPLSRTVNGSQKKTSIYLELAEPKTASSSP